MDNEEENSVKDESRAATPYVVVPVYRYDRPWWNGGMKMSYFTTSTMECDSIENSYVKNKSTAISACEWCPINYKGGYGNAGTSYDSSMRRAAFKIVTQFHNRQLGETPLYSFVSFDKGSDENALVRRQLLTCSISERNTLLQLNRFHSGQRDGDFVYCGTVGAVYMDNSVDSNLIPVYGYTSNDTRANIFTTDTRNLTGWVGRGVCFYAYAYNFNGTTGNDSTYALPY